MKTPEYVKSLSNTELLREFETLGNKIIERSIKENPSFGPNKCFSRQLEDHTALRNEILKRMKKRDV